MTMIMSLNELVLCPFQGLLDIANQLVDGESHARLTAHGVFQPIFELNTISDWVTVDDSLGDLTAIRAKELVDTLHLILQKQMLKELDIHINLGDCALTIDNYFALLFLSEKLNNLSVFFYVSPEKISALKTLTKTLHEQANCVIDYRHANRFKETLDFVQLAEDLKVKRNKALIQNGFEFYKNFDDISSKTYSATMTSNLCNFISYAWICLKAGSYQLGCQVLSSILCQPDLDSLIFEELFVHLQIIRFLSHQHHLVIAETFPEVFRFVAQERIKHLYFIKAFSATLTRNLPIAEECFKKAGIHQTMPMTDEESMYKLNLYALFLLLKGHADLAFDIEINIQNHSRVHFSNAAALDHVIFMNIARLYKKSKNYQLSAEYYAKAYEQLSSRGLTLFDRMSYRMDLAILDEARGRSSEALFSWVNVAIDWSSCENPYSLAVKQRLVLCQENITQTLLPLSIEKVNRFLLEKLNYLCVLANINLEKAVKSPARDLPRTENARPFSSLESDLHQAVSSLIHGQLKYQVQIA